MATLARRLASRVRRGLSRRVSPLLERAGLRAPRTPDGSGTSPRSDAPVAAAVPPAPEPSPAAPPPAASAPVAPVTAAPAAEDRAGPPLLTRAEVERVLEDMVRPALQSDGGDIELVSVSDNDVYVELTGACHTCPSSIVTMQDGIERLLREEFPHLGRLVRVDG
jgi:Fe-S cluster biogenesis protein NfuA